nr:unnamed protein product [Digitaria exilis]
MAVHHPNLLDLPPNTVVAMEPPHQQQLSFDHGQLLALHATDGGMSSASVSLSLYNLDDTTPSLMFGHIQQQLMPAAWSMMSSKYLDPAQELLTDLPEGDLLHDKQRRPPPSSSSSSGGHPSSLMSSMDLLELERRKTRLLSMVEEV